jgi:hypothetical protein
LQTKVDDGDEEPECAEKRPEDVEERGEDEVEKID